MNALLAALMLASVGWSNLDNDHHLAGRKTSENYLCGKIVMVYRWGANSESSSDMLAKVEAIWQSFKSQRFVLIGSHCSSLGSAERVRELAKENEVTFPVYADAEMVVKTQKFKACPLFYVITPDGKLAHRGTDERVATDTVVRLIAEWESPDSVKSWKKILDYETRELPAHAIVDFEGFKKAFPKDAAEYEVPVGALKRIKGIDELVNLIRTARKVGAFIPGDDKQRKQIVEHGKETLAKYSHLKESKDPQIRRDAKNALADLAWALNEL